MPLLSVLTQQITLLHTYSGMSWICSQHTQPRTSFRDCYCFQSFPYIDQVWLPVPTTRCDVMTFITCNYNPMHTSALMVRVYSSFLSNKLHTHQNLVIPFTVVAAWVVRSKAATVRYLRTVALFRSV